MRDASRNLPRGIQHKVNAQVHSTLLTSTNIINATNKAPQQDNSNKADTAAKCWPTQRPATSTAASIPGVNPCNFPFSFLPNSRPSERYYAQTWKNHLRMLIEAFHSMTFFNTWIPRTVSTKRTVVHLHRLMLTT